VQFAVTIFKNFRNNELGVIAFAFEEEDDNQISQRARKKIKWVHDARESKTVEGEF